jgi:transcriptional regulator with XRE-family HTH domain
MAGKNELQELSNYIMEQLKQKKIDPPELARLSGVSKTQIWRLISKLVRNPTIPTLEKLAYAFGKQPSILIEIVYPNRIHNVDNFIEKPIANPSLLIDRIFGHCDELSELIEYTDRSRLIFITGVIGLGKSTLAKTLRTRLSEEFTNIDPKKPIAEIISRLKEKRCFAILDNLDLEDKEYGESYTRLLEQIAKTKHPSCVIVTCRSLPKGYIRWEPRPKVLSLKGLPEPEAIAILKSQGLATGSEQEVRDLVKIYGGNPLGLKLAVEIISKKYKGDLSAYLEHSTVFVHDLHKEISSVIHHLTELELELLYWLVLRKEAICWSKIAEEFCDRYKVSIQSRDIDAAVEELIRFSFLQIDESQLKVQTEVQNSAESVFRHEILSEIKAIAANNMNKLRWLRSLDLADEQIKLCDRFSRYEPILIQALTQLEAQPKEQTVDAIGYAIANLRYLLGKPIE